MIIGVLKETAHAERRVAATPSSVEQLSKLGYSVVVDSGAGELSSIPDDAFVGAGASIGDAASADIVLALNLPNSEQLDRIRPGALLVGVLSPGISPNTLADLAARKITALALDGVPRISRAQSMDVLSSMANIAGYRAVVEAAHAFGRSFTGQVTAAGKVAPAKVLVAGAGVAGLAAIGAAGAMGAVVRATDPRPEVAEQVASLGGTYLSVDSSVGHRSATGYAREMTADYQQRERALYADQCRDVNIVITTALIPGKPAPRLITADMVALMQPGSVIVDMAAASGGNVEGTRPGQSYVTENGVTLIGYTDLPSRLPSQASQLYATNVLNLLKLLTPAADGTPSLDFNDVIIRSVTVTNGGEVTWPPPPVEVSVAPTAATETTAIENTHSAPSATARVSDVQLAVIGLAALLCLAAVTPTAMLGHLTVFVLAVVVGYYVIGHVHHALHTPLMSVTNAISGIVVAGAILQIGHDDKVITSLAFAATLLASINIFGGFAVTRRMLSMFSRSAEGRK